MTHAEVTIVLFVYGLQSPHPSASSTYILICNNLTEVCIIIIIIIEFKVIELLLRKSKHIPGA
jgi:hypothetical protein